MKPKTATNALAATADQQFAASEAEEIRRLLKRAAQDIVTVGQRLSAVKARLKHGEWGEYLRREFDWDERTAQRFMNVGERFKNDNLSDLNIAPSALYLLAAPSTPEEACRSILERARAGEKITVKDAQTTMKVAGIAVKIASEIEKSPDGLLPDLPERIVEYLAEKARRDRLSDEAFEPFLEACNERMVELRQVDTTTPEPMRSAFISEALRWLFRSGRYLSAYPNFEQYCWDRFGMDEQELNEYYGASSQQAETDGPQTLIIDPEFSSVMPRPRPEEYASIEADILRHGVCVPLKTWRGILLDGHVRYDICHKHGISFEVEEVDLPDRTAGLRYITSMHIRANWTEDQRAMIAVRLMDYAEANGVDIATFGD